MRLPAAIKSAVSAARRGHSAGRGPRASSASPAWRIARRAIVPRLRKRLHALALDLGLGGDPDEFVIALGERRQVEAVGLDDAAVRTAAP